MTRIYLMAAQHALTMRLPRVAMQMLRKALGHANRDGRRDRAARIMAAMSYTRRIVR